MRCPRCNYENPPHAKFCLECGTPLGRIHEGGKLAAAYRDLDAVMDRRTFLATIAGGLLVAPPAAETFSGSCQAIVF
jgi:zinc ribbon protein